MFTLTGADKFWLSNLQKSNFTWKHTLSFNLLISFNLILGFFSFYVSPQRFLQPVILYQTWIHQWWCLPPWQGYTHHQYSHTHHNDGGRHRHYDVQVNPLGEPRKAPGLCLSVIDISPKWRGKGSWNIINIPLVMAAFLLLMTQMTMMAMTMTARAATTGTIRLTLVTKAISWDSRSVKPPEPPGEMLSLTSLAGARAPKNRCWWHLMAMAWPGLVSWMYPPRLYPEKI